MAVRISIQFYIEDGEIDPNGSWEDFWAEVDVINAYEDDWEDNFAPENNKHFWEPYYKAIYEEIQTLKKELKI